MAAPNITEVGFYGSQLRVGQGTNTHKGNGDPVITLGYIIGSEICNSSSWWATTVYRVEIRSNSSKKCWVGRITSQSVDGFGRTLWHFAVVNTKNDADPETDNTTVTVTVTNPTITTGPQTGTSQPQPVPLNQIP
jgi:hypothetical protein